MNKVKLYKIYAIAENLKFGIHNPVILEDKMSEIMDLCEEIVTEHDNAFLSKWRKTICSKI